MQLKTTINKIGSLIISRFLQFLLKAYLSI
jgi:hypothetical protein